MTIRLEPVTGDTAPEASRSELERVRKQYGYVPNLLATLANSPTALRSFLSLEAAWSAGTLSAVERQIVLLTASVSNACTYCETAHAAAASMLKVDPAVIDAIRHVRPVPDGKIAALAGLTRELVTSRGHATDSTIDVFLAAGYTGPQILEVLVGIALKTISNYLDHISPVEVDAKLRGFLRAAA
jgi:uncharacterized peroxidase-related enzyme